MSIKPLAEVGPSTRRLRQGYVRSMITASLVDSTEDVEVVIQRVATYFNCPFDFAEEAWAGPLEIPL